VSEADRIPPELLGLRDRCAALAGKDPQRFGVCLVNRYPRRAGIGWHRDAPIFGAVVGVRPGEGGALVMAAPDREVAGAPVFGHLQDAARAVSESCPSPAPARIFLRALIRPEEAM
jgi:hypothetical protein